MSAAEKEALFWDLANPLMITQNVEKGTMMGFPCLRINGKFFASLERESKNMIVKLPAARVKELVTNGDALPFAPNGRTFREWAQFEHADEAGWGKLLREALEFVAD